MTDLRIKTGPPQSAPAADARGGLTLGNLLAAVGVLFFFMVLLDGFGFFDRLPEADRALNAALDGNDPEAVQAALEAGALVSRRDLIGGSHLHTAAYRGQLEVASVLVSHGLEPDVRNHAGVTPLHLAASSGHRDLAEWLIRQGAQVDAKTTAFVERCDGDHFQIGFTPLDVARQAGQRPLVELLERAARR